MYLHYLKLLLNSLVRVLLEYLNKFKFSILKMFE